MNCFLVPSFGISHLHFLTLLGLGPGFKDLREGTVNELTASHLDLKVFKDKRQTKIEYLFLSAKD